MPYLLVRQKFTDYPQWRAAFDELAEQRAAEGIRTVLVTRNTEDLNEAVVLFEFTEIERVRRHFTSAALQDAHRSAGVTEGTVQATYLQPAE